MSIQSAIVFGLILGVTFFLVYLSILAQRDQGIINSPSAQGGHLLENLLANKLDNAQDISKPTGVLPDTKQNDIQIVSLSKAELSLLRKDHSAITTSTDVSMSKTTSTSSKKKSIPTEDEREDQRKNELLKKMKKEKISKFNELSPEIACMRMKKKFHVVPNISWGTLPTELQQKWSELNCDHHLPSDHSGTHSHEEENQPEENQRTNESEQKKQEQQPSTEKDSDEEFCWANRKKYQVQPMKSWGNLPLPLIEQWKQRNCDAVFTRQRLNSMPLTNCRHILNHYSNKDLPLIALMAATTTRKVMQPSTKKLALFLYLLPSFARTVDCGFRYEYILGYDVGDPYYDNDAGIKEVKEWFYKNIEKPLKENAISLTLRLVKVKNTLKKPGPVFNEMARVAYSQSNATYFYRVNDDTELLTHWPTIFVKGIHALSIPYGVIGPWCNQGNEKILTHDFVHRIHMEIFEMNYYPPQLTDWWMDDWISFVYGQTRTFKASVVKVIHHTGAHGQRYTVDETHFHLLGDLIKEGRQKIRKYMLKNNIPESILKVFDKDVFQAGFLHRDLPKL